ncbi:MAG: peptidyl-tRNA hydrolase [Thermoprotei archaeon]|nr:MAG: peptidyl-tRNA hydrolase [Thermoprotei archaeon]
MVSQFKYKQVIAVRSDIKMSKGKLAVQVAHAAVEASIKAHKEKPEWLKEWLREGQKKVVVSGGGEGDLLSLAAQAERMGLPYAVIRDAGLTELKPGTLTAVAIGPAPSDLVDKITGRLNLL